jgi:hypothetical protein
MGVEADSGVRERMLRDVQRAEVFAPDVHNAPKRATRVFITTERIVVWQTDDQNRPTVFLDSRITGELPQADRATLVGQLRIETEDGDVHITRARGCMCGSSLLALSPPIPW